MDPAISLRDARPTCFWLDRDDITPPPRATAVGAIQADLVIVGGGYTGLWAAVAALTRDPGRRVVVVERDQVGTGASGRNGGFCMQTLTHGALHGMAAWPDEFDQIQRIAVDHFEEFFGDIDRLNIRADVERTGALDMATRGWQTAEQIDEVPLLQQAGIDATFLDAEQIRSLVDSPTYLSAVRIDGTHAIADPAKLTWGLADAVEALGGQIFERSAVRGIERIDGQVVVTTADATISAPRAIVGTNAWTDPAPATRRYIVPVYDYALMTEPLSPSQMAAIGWSERQGLGDAGNQFHYYRLTADNRVLFGGYDAIYKFGSRIDPATEHSGTTHHTLARNFFHTFPQLEGLSFTHRWAGPIATTSRFTAAWGTSMDGQLAWVGGYTGAGVVASRFGANVALDLVDGRHNERTELEMVQRRPMPFPPEPLRWVGIQMTRRAMIRADANQGQRGPWLRTLDRLGMGFDS